MTVGDVLQAHEDALAYGGLPGIRSLDLLYSAIGRPYSGYYRTIYRKAAAFVDGNKRTALRAVDLIIRQSDYRYGFPLRQVELTLESLILALVEHRIDYNGAVDVFKRIIYPRRAT